MWTVLGPVKVRRFIRFTKLVRELQVGGVRASFAERPLTTLRYSTEELVAQSESFTAKCEPIAQCFANHIAQTQSRLLADTDASCNYQRDVVESYLQRLIG